MATAKHSLSFFIAIYAAVFCLLGLLGYYTAGEAGWLRQAVVAPGTVNTLAYYDLPRMTIAMGGNGRYVRLDITLEVAKEDIYAIDGMRPRILDRLNVFFGALKSDQIESASAPSWLRNETLGEVKKAVAPVQVRDVMFRQFMII